MPDKKNYFEAEFAKWADDGKDYTSDMSICIVGTREPSPEEATDFCKGDLEKLGYDFVSNVFPLSDYEAHEFFDMAEEDSFPVFR